MTSGTGMEVAAVVKLLRIRYFWGEKYESSVTELPGTCITAAAIDDISLSLSPPLRRVQHFSIEKVMQNRYKKSYTDIVVDYCM